MKFASLYLTALLGCLAPGAYAFKERGVAERILYYSAYLAEEISARIVRANGAEFEFTVAPLCVGSRNGRCNMDEFLIYIWKETNGDKVAPTSWKRGKNTGFGEIASLSDLNTVFNKIKNSQYNTEKQPDRGTDGLKLLTTVTDGNYYDVLAGMGEPIASAEAAGEAAGALTPAERNFFEFGREAADLVTKLRWKDYEGFRIRGLVKDLPGITIKTQTLQTGLADTKLNTYDVIDFHGIIEDNIGQYPDIYDRLDASIFKYRNNIKNVEHQRAIKAAQAAAWSCNCLSELTTRPLKARL